MFGYVSCNLSSLSLTLSLLSAAVILGFDRTYYAIDELSEEGAVVTVKVLFGQLEWTVAIRINSTEASTATANLGVCE